MDDNGGRKKNRTATNSVPHTVANIPPVSKAKPDAKKVVTKKKKLVKKASVKKPVKKPTKKVSVKMDSVKKYTPKYSDFLANPLSTGSAWMGEILGSLGTSDYQGERLPNGDIANSVDCHEAVFDHDVDLEDLVQ
jgi:hypothetical protein